MSEDGAREAAAGSAGRREHDTERPDRTGPAAGAAEHGGRPATDAEALAEAVVGDGTHAEETAARALIETAAEDAEAAGALHGATGIGGPEAVLSVAPPEGAGRAASGDAPAPARQWPLLSVLALSGLGLLVVGTHPFQQAFRVGCILIGIALMGGAALRRFVPSVGMLAVRSRFTDMLTYGVLGAFIVLLALMTQPSPWLEVPFLEDVVHSTVQ